MKQAVIAIVFALLGSLTSFVLANNTSPYSVALWDDGPRVQLALDQWGNIIKPRLLFVNGDQPNGYEYELVFTDMNTDETTVSLPRLQSVPWRAENIFLKSNTGLKKHGIQHSYNWSVISYDANENQVGSTQARRLLVSTSGNEFDAGIEFITGNQIIPDSQETLEIKWRDDLPFNEGATLSLYFANDENRWVIGGVENIAIDNTDSEVDGVDTAIWNMAGVAKGDHKVFAVVNEGNHSTVYDCCVITTPEIDSNAAPVLSVPNSITLSYDGSANGLDHENTQLTDWLALANANDDINGAVPVTNNLSDLPNPIPAGAYTITFNAMDVSGNVTTNTAALTVTFKSDSVAPVVTAPANIAMQFDAGTAGLSKDALSAWLLSAYATDNVDSSVMVFNNIYIFTDPLGAGSYMVTFSAQDSSGNIGSATATVTVSEAVPQDTVNPVVVAPANIVREYAFGTSGVSHSELQSWLAQASATDNVDGNLTVSNTLYMYSNPLLSGSYSVAFTATDAAGNSDSKSATVVVNEADEIPTADNPETLDIWFTVEGDNTGMSPNNETVNLVDFKVLGTHALLNIQGGATSVKYTNMDLMGGDQIVEPRVGQNTGFLPDVLMNDVQWREASFTSEFSGLEAGASYQIKFTGSRTSGTGRAIDVAFGASSGSFESGSNTNDGVILSAVADLNGKIAFNLTSSAPGETSDTGGNGYIYFSGFVFSKNGVGENQPPVINDQSLNVIEGSDLDIVLGPLEDSDGDTLVYSVTGSSDFVVGSAANTIRFNSLALGLQTLNVTVNDGRGGSDTATISVTVTLEPVLIATNIAYNGWSTMNYTLSGQNTGSSTSPTDDHNPSLYTLVGQMYAANGITGYAHDFAFLPQGSEFIDGTDALENINTTSATVAVLSAYGSTSGITMDPASANISDGWIDRMINAAVVAEARGIKPIMFQAWGSADSSDKFPNAKINTDALQAKHGMLIVRSAEIVEALGQLNASYIVNSVSPGGKYTPPVTHLYSGDSADNFHGSYALAYANALATFKCLTGISATDNQFVIPSGGAAGEQYGMSAVLIADIISVVDGVQRESLVSGLAEGAAPLANNFERDAEHNVELAINISSAASLLDDVEIVPENFLVKSITASHYSNYSLNNNIFKFTAADAYTGLSDIVFTYTDADNQAIDITMVVNIVPEIVIEPQEIIIGFGLGDWSSFGSPGNLYNHGTTESGQVVNGIRGFNTASTQGNLQDSTGLGVGSITSLTSGNLSGPGFGGNDDPAVDHYGPYTYLYEGLSIAPKGSSVAFSVNGLESDTAYRVNMAGRYPSDNTNIVNVDVNGVLGNFDSNRSNITEYEKVVATDKSGRLVIALSSDGTTAASNWGISYVHINKITDGTLADTPVAPRFIEQPQSLNVTEGANATFSVAVSGTYSLQWYRDDVIINGETASSYTLTTATADNGAVFTVKATNKGGVTESEPAVLTLLTEPPEITQQPLSAVSVMDGNKLSLNVVATGAVNYQWKKDGLEIAGENGDKLSMPIAMDDDGAVFTVSVSNPFGSVESIGTILTVNPLLQQYWFSLGRSDGKASNFTSSFTNFIPGVAAEGANGEDINFIRGFTESPVNLSGIFRDTTGSVTDLSVSYSSTGSNTDSIAGWGDFNSDIILNANVINVLNAKSWTDHANLYAYHIYMASGHQVTLEFDNGGLVSGDEWQIQILGLHYQDESRPVDVLLNGNGTSGNMTVGSWDNIAIFDQMVNVDSSGKLQIKIAPQVNANINAIRLIKTGN